jgi:hypothetical protein
LYPCLYVIQIIEEKAHIYVDFFLKILANTIAWH